MGCLSSMRLSYEYVERLVGGVIDCLGAVLRGKRLAVAGSWRKDVWGLDFY
jgi:hypothetical protein